MKYYCKTCGTEVVIGSGVDLSKYFENGLGLECYLDWEHGSMSRVPDYETPEEYKERTGKPFPDNGLVWFREREWYFSNGSWTSWIGKEFGQVMGIVSDEEQMVIADPPVPPPDDWRPE